MRLPCSFIMTTYEVVIRNTQLLYKLLCSYWLPISDIPEIFHKSTILDNFQVLLYFFGFRFFGFHFEYGLITVEVYSRRQISTGTKFEISYFIIFS